MSDPIPLPKVTTATESRGRAWRKDILAGLVNAIVSVPDGLACAALAGVNPVYGLYTSVAAPIGGSLLMNAQLMQIDRAVHLVPADQIFGASTRQAVAHASAWLGSTRDDPPNAGE